MSKVEKISSAQIALEEYNHLTYKIKMLEIEIEFLENNYEDLSNVDFKNIDEKYEAACRLNIENYFNVANNERLLNLKKVCQFLKMRKNIIDVAIESLEQDDELNAKIIKGLYIDNMKWEALGGKLYMSNNTINRRRKAGLKYIEDNLATMEIFKR